MLDKSRRMDIIVMSNDTAGLCNGSTPDSDSVCEGSNPSPAAKEQLRIERFWAVLFYFHMFRVRKVIDLFS